MAQIESLFVTRLYRADLSEHGKTIDPNESSVSDHFGKTPKTIRNWLHKADAALEKKWRGVHNE